MIDTGQGLRKMKSNDLGSTEESLRPEVQGWGYVIR